VGGSAGGGSNTGGGTGNTGGGGGNTGGGGGSSGGGGGSSGGGGGTCELLPAIVDRTITLASACSPVLPAGSVEIVKGGHLVIEAGVTVRFAPAAVLRVAGGTLTTRGTQGSRVVLEGVSPLKGSWQGVLSSFSGNDFSTVTLAGTTVRHGGFDGGEALGCLSVNRGPVRNLVSVTASSFEECEVFGVLVLAASQDFVAFSDVTIHNADIAMSVHPDVVGSIAAGLTLDPGAHLDVRAGSLVHSQTWLPQGEPWRLVQSFNVDHLSNPVLTLAPGLRIVAVAQVAINVGSGFGGALIATNVSFVSEGAGPWAGIRLRDFTRTSVLDGVTVSGTGGVVELGYLPSGVVMKNTGANVTVRNSTFSGNATDIRVCNSTPTLTNNTATVVIDTGC